MISTLLSTIVPPAAIAVEVCDAGQASDLFPEEARLLGNVSEKRRVEFCLGRSCAHQALARLGTEPQPILRGASREPIWPNGIVGSITHCDGFYAAAVAWKQNIAGFGIDAEPIRPVSQDLLRLIATETEVSSICRLEQSAHRSIPWQLLLFSAKESIFKTWFPLVGTWLDFTQVTVEFSETDSGFRASISELPTEAASLSGRIEGRFIVGKTHVITCAHVAVN